MKTTSSVPVNPRKWACITSSMCCPFAKRTIGTSQVAAYRYSPSTKARDIGATSAVEAIGKP